MKQKGFTLVEMLIAIVVIAILAAISVVSYGHITTDAKDTARRAAAKEVQKALVAFMIRKQHVVSWGDPSNAVDSATGLCKMPSGGSEPWDRFTLLPNNIRANQCTPGDMLVAAGMMTADFWDKLPKNEAYSSGPRHATQGFARCMSRSSNHGIYLYYYVKKPTSEETALMNDLLTKCGHRASVAKNAYKMNAAIRVSD